MCEPPTATKGAGVGVGVGVGFGVGVGVGVGFGVGVGVGVEGSTGISFRRGAPAPAEGRVLIQEVQPESNIVATKIVKRVAAGIFRFTNPPLSILHFMR